MSHRKEGELHILRFPGLADFQLAQDASRISCYPAVDMPQETLAHLLIDQVLPRCLAQRGDLLVHASAVAIHDKLLLFMGGSRSGKSTLAGSFHQAGYLAVCDDAVLIREESGDLQAIPSYPGLRLWPDSLEFLFGTNPGTQTMAHYSEKKRMLLAATEERRLGLAAPILAVILLSPAESDQSLRPALSKPSLRDAYMELERQSFLLDPADSTRVREHVQALGRVVRMLRTFQLTGPRDYGSLASTRGMILDRVL